MSGSSPQMALPTLMARDDPARCDGANDEATEALSVDR